MMVAATVRLATLVVVLTCLLVTTSADAHQQQVPLNSDSSHTVTPEMHGYTVNDDGRWTIRTPEKLDKSQLNEKLIPFAFEPLPLGSIQPLGWMKDQMQLMADGLPGQLHTFYRIIENATWLGGTEEYSKLNEAWPYWYNGIVALAYGLNDDRLKREVDRVTDYVLEHQFEDGWLGPEKDLNRRNFWGRYPFLLGMMQLIEAVDEARSEVLLDSLHRFVKLMHEMLEQDKQGYVRHGDDEFNEQWGRSRVADMIIFLQWLYEHHPRDNSRIILESMVHFYEDSFDWTYWFQDDVFMKGDFDEMEGDDVRRKVFPYVHAVNAGQGLKYGSVMRRLTHMDKYINDTLRGTTNTFKYHGTPSGAIVGDEGESGVLPHRGTELCSVVETIYSLTYNYHALGDKYYADRAELAAYNALPAMITSDWWAHQYIAQSNQPISHRINHPPFYNVGPLGTTFGTEPNYPCCTVNFGQGLPKFLAASFARNGNDGIVHAFPMPAEVKTTIKDTSNDEDKRVHIQCDTQYPFKHVLKYTIDNEAAFNFSFRQSGWAVGLSMVINGVDALFEGVYNSTSGLWTINFPVPVQGRKNTLVVRFLTSPPTVEERNNDTVAVHFGAVLYALPVPATWSGTRPARYPGTSAPASAQDWTVIPEEGYQWNIGIDPSTLRQSASVEEESVDLNKDDHHNNNTKTDHDDDDSNNDNEIDGDGGDDDDDDDNDGDGDGEKTLPNPIWTVDAIPVLVSVMACELADWKLTDPQEGYAPPPPPAIPGVRQRRCTSRPFEVELQPYGALKVHMAEFPRMDLRDDRHLT